MSKRVGNQVPCRSSLTPPGRSRTSRSTSLHRHAPWVRRAEAAASAAAAGETPGVDSDQRRCRLRWKSEAGKPPTPTHCIPRDHLDPVKLADYPLGSDESTRKTAALAAAAAPSGIFSRWQGQGQGHWRAVMQHDCVVCQRSQDNLSEIAQNVLRSLADKCAGRLMPHNPALPELKRGMW